MVSNSKQKHKTFLTIAKNTCQISSFGATFKYPQKNFSTNLLNNACHFYNSIPGQLVMQKYFAIHFYTNTTFSSVAGFQTPNFFETRYQAFLVQI